MAAQPVSVKLCGRHVLGARNLSTTRRRAAVAGERLGHIPLRGRIKELYGVTDCQSHNKNKLLAQHRTHRQLITGLQSLLAGKNLHILHVDDLPPSKSSVFIAALDCLDTHVSPKTNQRRLARVIQIQQVAVQEDVPMPPGLHRSIRRFADESARRLGEFCEQGPRRDGDAGHALGGEGAVGSVYDLLDSGVGGLRPVGGQGRHGGLFGGLWHRGRSAGQRVRVRYLRDAFDDAWRVPQGGPRVPSGPLAHVYPEYWKKELAVFGLG